MNLGILTLGAKSQTFENFLDLHKSVDRFIYSGRPNESDRF